MGIAEQEAVSMDFQESSGNVFADLGLEDSEELLTKARLAAAIHKVMEARGLSQVRAGEIMGFDQPKVSLLVRGRLDRFSIERLMRALNSLGQDVWIKVQPATQGEGRGRTLVEAG
jgi:predicted XRE-type DNA-binding protein